MKTIKGGGRSATAMCIFNFKRSAISVGLFLPLIAVSGCGLLAPGSAQPERGGRSQPDGPIAVQTATAEAGSVDGQLTYTGTTEPTQQVTLRSQVDGVLVDLSVDLGDRVTQGDTLAQLDGNLQTTNVNEAQAELFARRAETAQAQVSINDARAAVARAQATLGQAQRDATRLRYLANQGALSIQEAEAAELAVTDAQQAVLSAQAQVNAQQQAAAAAASQVDAQQAILAQTQQQLVYAELRSPLTGIVLSRQAEVGDFVESGATVLELGDLSNLEVTIQVSELDIAKISLGQPARVKLDAFPDEGSILGRVQKISPVANATSRLIPVQVSIPNLNAQISSGLLARVQFSADEQETVVIPQSALTVGQAENTVFVIEQEGEETTAIARTVRTGERNQNRVAILSGLDPGDTFVLKSDRPLTDRQPVRLSILSEGQPDQRGDQ
ncbi:MAG: efflux RND transporter periplasmic adaptor subunit [Cyanobacteria bacterium J06649_4]